MSWFDYSTCLACGGIDPVTHLAGCPIGLAQAAVYLPVDEPSRGVVEYATRRVCLIATAVFRTFLMRAGAGRRTSPSQRRFPLEGRL